MKRSWWLALAALAMMLGVAHGPRIWAKPPDLPADNQIQCPEFGDDPVQRRFSIELDITPKDVTLKLGAGLAMPEPTVAIDAVCPCIVPAYVQLLFNRMKSVFAQPPAMQGAQMELDLDKQATRLFEIGEVYRRTGHYASARFYYQRVHQTAPTSRLGRLAMDRIGEIEDRLREAEGSSEVDPEQLFHEMRDRTIPLGLAQLATY